MYAVVGCSDCSALWVVDGEPQTTRCPRCGRRHQFRRLKRLVTTDDPDAAREARAALLADRSGHGEAFATLDSFAEMDRDTAREVVPDDVYLERSGIDATEVAAAGERAARGHVGTSREQVVRDALRTLDAPTEDDVAEYAAEEGVPADYVRDALTKLTCAGEVTESRGHYRLL